MFSFSCLCVSTLQYPPGRHFVFIGLSLSLQYPPGYVEAMANKTKKEANARPGCTRSKKQPGRGRPRLLPLEKKVKEDEKKPMEGTEQPQSNGSQKTPKDKETGTC